MSTLAVGLALMKTAFGVIRNDLGDKGLARTLWLLSSIGPCTGLWIVMGLWGIVAPSVSWVFQIPTLRMLALTPVLVGLSGSLRLPVHEE